MNRRTALSLALALVATTGCDSLPDAFAPEGAAWQAELQVYNAGSRRITAIEAECEALTRINRRTLDVAPGQRWSGKYPEGVCFLRVEFFTGGGWTTSVTFSADSPSQISPF